jgi:aldehyde dehydrogenase (NAD+)
MTLANETAASLQHADRFFIGGTWVQPSSDATIQVIDSTNEEVFLTVAEAQGTDMANAVAAAREAFDKGPWPRMSHAERAGYLRAMADGLKQRTADLGQVWPREAGVLHSIAQYAGIGSASTFEYYAGLAETFAFEEQVTPSGGEFGLLVREPVGVVGAIIPWNAPMTLISYKVAPALLAGCTVILKSSPEAPGEGYVVAEVAEAVGLPAGCPQCGHRRPGSLGAAGARSGRRQDHLHRLHGGGPAHRLALRRADRPMHPRARREVGRRHPR